MKASPVILSRYNSLKKLEGEIEEMIKVRRYRTSVAYTNNADWEKADGELDELTECYFHTQRNLVSLASTFEIED